MGCVEGRPIQQTLFKQTFETFYQSARFLDLNHTFQPHIYIFFYTSESNRQNNFFYKYKYSTSKRHLKEIIKSHSCSFQCVKYTTASNLSIFLEKRNCEISFRFKAIFMFIIKRKYPTRGRMALVFFSCPGTSSYADELTGPLGQTHVQHHNRPHDRLHDQHHDWQKL